MGEVKLYIQQTLGVDAGGHEARHTFPKILAICVHAAALRTSDCLPNRVITAGMQLL